MSYRRQTLEAEVKKAVELVVEDEVWQGAFDDFERMMLKNFAVGYIRAYAYRQLHPRRAALRLLKMLNAAAAAIAPEHCPDCQKSLDNFGILPTLCATCGADRTHAAAAIAPEEGSVQSAQSESGKNNDDNNH